MLKRILVLIGALLLVSPAMAQQSVPMPSGGFWLDLTASPSVWRPISGTYPLPVTASVSVGPFLPSLSYATCTATNSACASTAIPTNTGSMILFNTGTTTVSCTLASGAATGATNKLQIPSSSGIGVATTGLDHFACIDQTGSTSNIVIASGGSGLPTGWGGGGSGGGGGGAITMASGAVSSGAYSSGSIASGAYASGAFASGAAASGSWAAGAIVDITNGTDTAYAGSGSTSLDGYLKGIYNAATGAIPAGTSIIGKVGIDQTTPGTTNGVDPTTAASWGIGAPAATAPTKGVLHIGRAATTEPTAVTDGQSVAQQMTASGKTITQPYAPKELTLNGEITTAMTGTTSTAVTGMGAQGGSIRNYVTACTFSNTHATVGTLMLLQDGSGGTTLWQAPAAAAGGGAHVIFPTPIKTTANTALYAQNVTTGANTYLSCTGYTGP